MPRSGGVDVFAGLHNRGPHPGMGGETTGRPANPAGNSPERQLMLERLAEGDGRYSERAFVREPRD